jgi:hypothetical protein
MKANGYQTSSKAVNDIILLDGLNAFELIRIRHFATRDNALDYEVRFLIKVDAINHQNIYLNKTNGHKKYIGSPYDNKRKLRISNDQLGRKWWNDGTINKKFKDDPGDGWVIGPLLTDSQRKRNSEKSIGLKAWNDGNVVIMSKICPDDKIWKRGNISIKGLPNSTKGTKFWNDGTTNKRSIECPGDGWMLGRFLSEQNREINIMKSKNRKHWNNGIVTKTFDSPPRGEEWILGRLK